MEVLCLALSIYWVILFVRIISSWFPTPTSGPMRTVMRFVYDVTDPVLRPFRNLIPPLRAGAVAVDFSPIIVFVIINVVHAALGCGLF